MKWLGRLCGIWLVLLLGAVAAGAVYAQGAADEEESFAILMASPGEGETFYTAAMGFRLSMPISGRVVSYGAPLNPAQIEVTIDLVGADGQRYTTVKPIDDTGYFEAWASMLAPDLPWPSDDPHVEDTCGSCHRAQPALELPLDVAYVEITARSADGRVAQATRHLNFDRGEYRDLPVRIDGLPEGAAALQVQATTQIYDWRYRTFYASVVDGQSTIAIEGLHHADLNYDILMVPQIIDGTLYTTRPIQVVAPRDQDDLPAVTLRARPTRATLSGQLLATDSDEGVSADVLLVNLASGVGQVLTAADGVFSVDDLDVAEHVLHAQAAGYFHLPYPLDFSHSSTVEAEVHLIPGGDDVFHGTIQLDGLPLPFAEVTVSGLPPVHVDPLTGDFTVRGAQLAEDVTVDVAAAGCYSLRLTPTESDLGTLSLTLHEDTAIIRQGAAQVVRPAASILTPAADGYMLERGVVWVRGGGSSEAELPIQVGMYAITGRGADYALENLPGARPRVYVQRGTVQATRLDSGDAVTVEEGQVFTLSGEASHPADMSPGAGSLLRAVAGSVSSFELAPSPAEQREAAVSAFTVTTARVFMLLAYAIIFVVMPVTVLGMGVIAIRRRRR